MGFMPAANSLTTSFRGPYSRYTVWGEVERVDHSKIRKYYITRNSIYVMKKYPKVRFFCFKELMKIIIKLLLVEPDKSERLLHMCKDVRDALTGKMGKIEL